MAAPNASKSLSNFGQQFIKLAEGAEELAAEKVQAAEKLIHDTIKRDITQPLFDVLVSFLYHVGAGTPPSALLAAVNSGDDAKVRGMWMSYVVGRDKDGVIKTFPALVKRRASELQYWAAYEAQGQIEQHEPDTISAPPAAKKKLYRFLLPGATAASILALVGLGAAYLGAHHEQGVMMLQVKEAAKQCPIPVPMQCPEVKVVPITTIPAAKPLPVHHKAKQKAKSWFSTYFGG